MIEPKRRQYGKLDCIVVDSGNQPETLVVICHGYGASHEDLAPLSFEWIGMLGESESSYRFIFPDAPNSLAEYGMPFGKAWWPINMAQLAEMVEASAFDELHRHEPPGIDAARGDLSEMIHAAYDEIDSDQVNLVIGGFSQGAMLTMDVALRGEIPIPAALMQFSGTMICKEIWMDLVSKRLSKTKVFQSHGTLDPILPFTSAEVVRDMLIGSGVSVDFHSFAGPHTIDVESIAKSGQLIKAVV